jgi:hypothetical protein
MRRPSGFQSIVVPPVNPLLDAHRLLLAAFLGNEVSGTDPSDRFQVLTAQAPHRMPRRSPPGLGQLTPGGQAGLAAAWKRRVGGLGFGAATTRQVGALSGSQTT